MKLSRLAATLFCGLIFVAGIAGIAGASEGLAPLYPFAGTSNNQPFSLEDYRGQVTVFIFFNDASS